LDLSEADKPLLDVEDFAAVSCCHWVTDTRQFPQERQRLQLATILLLVAYTRSHPTALLSIQYSDISLFAQRNPKKGAIALTLQLQLKRTKACRRGKKKSP